MRLGGQARGGLPAGRDEWVKNAIQLSGFFLSSGRSLSAARSAFNPRPYTLNPSLNIKP